MSRYPLPRRREVVRQHAKDTLAALRNRGTLPSMWETRVWLGQVSGDPVMVARADREIEQRRRDLEGVDRP